MPVHKRSRAFFLSWIFHSEKQTGQTASAFGPGIFGQQLGGVRRTFACRHRPEEMGDELNAIVDQGCTVLDVIVEHPVYGQLTAPLHASSRYDVAQFLDRCRRSGASPLSNLTGGVHLHTVSCPDGDAARRVEDSLRRLGFLYEPAGETP